MAQAGKKLLYVPTRRLLPAMALSGALLFNSGCRRAAVEHFSPTLETRITVADPAVYVKPQAASAEKDPWYRELQVVLDQPAASEADLAAKVEEQKPKVNESVKKLLDEVAAAVNEHRNANDRWSVITLTCGKTRKTSDLQLTADIGLTGLYAKRPVIAFNELPIELCVAKLAREAGIHESQPRGYNPSVTWSQTDTSVAEAFDAVLPSHGFEHKFSDTTYKAAVRVQDFNSRQEFIEGAWTAILAKGKMLNSARPAVLVTQKEKPAPPPPTTPEPSKRAVPVPPPKKRE